MTQFAVCSYSFHRALAAGEQDIFRYISDCKELGMAQLDPWNGHLVPISEESDRLKASDPDAPLSSESIAYLEQVKAAGDAVELSFGCVAVDGAHVYEPTAEARRANRGAAYRWIDAARRLGARQIRLDAGGPEELTDEIFDIIVEGYHDIVKRAADNGVEVVMENHWGSSHIPTNVVRILDAVDGLGLLFDSHNWAEGLREEGWQRCAKYARAAHIKTFEFDDDGNDPAGEIPRVIHLLADAGYDDVWGIESVPYDGDEYGAVKKTMALIERSLQG
ncbi:MAG: hypothetical protein D6737_10860 [Chloroflexi bacterium]|nr:MAG: hypothetical protein CUN54_01720 [Phototrophicales bacterium]RMF79606.1 MAG: hypothetical protein D6737_10860 [Chloroflexota bacterium]